MSNHDDFNWVLLAVTATVLIVIVAALFNTGKDNAEKQQQYRLACIQAGGSFVEDACINPRVVP